MTARKAELHPAVAVLIPVLLIAVYWATRFVNPTLLPIFNDEAQYLHWVSLINQGTPNLWVSLQTDNNKPLLYWLIALVWRYFDDPLSAGRAVSAITGFFSMIGIYSIVCHLHSKWAGWIAAPAARSREAQDFPKIHWPVFKYDPHIRPGRGLFYL